MPHILNETPVITEILEGFARALFVHAWANDCEERGDTEGWGGADLCELAPPTSTEAIEAARSALQTIAANNSTAIEVAWCLVRLAEEDATAENFGWYLGMEWLGSGVQWDDSREPHELTIGRGEYHEDFSTEGSDQ